MRRLLLLVPASIAVVALLGVVAVATVSEDGTLTVGDGSPLWDGEDELADDSLSVEVEDDPPLDPVEPPEPPDPPDPVDPVEAPETVRFAGDDRYDTARLIATDGWDAADTAILATGEAFPDALTGAFLAGAHDAPMLLTRSDSLPQATADALAELGVNTVWVLGGDAAVSDGVEAALPAQVTSVTRAAGDDRYETATEIADAGGFDGGEVFLATGEDFADALSVGVLSISERSPVLLTRTGSLPQATAEWLTANAEAVSRVTVLGGPAAVAEGVVSEVEASVPDAAVSRLSGADRTRTAEQVYQRMAGNGFANVGIARGDLFPDGLTIGPFLATTLDAPAPIALTWSPIEARAATDVLTDNCEALEDHARLWIAGGTAAISTDLQESLEEARSSCLDESG